MATTYKVLGQATTASQTSSLATKALTSNVVTMTTSAAHSLVVGENVTIVDATLSYTVTNKALTSNVATLTIGTHRFLVGSSITVSGVDATFNGTYTVTAIAATTVSYAKITTNVTSASSSGTVTGKDPVFNGTFTVTSTPTNTSFTYDYISSNFAQANTTGTATYFPWVSVYTCPAATSALTTTVTVANRGIFASTYRIAVTGSTTPQNKDYIVYNDVIDGRDTVTLTMAMTVDSTVNKIMVCGSTANLSFNVFGMEITA
jgi:hypothetical protein